VINNELNEKADEKTEENNVINNELNEKDEKAGENLVNDKNSQKIDEIRKEIERIKDQQIHERKKKREEKEKKEEEFYLNKKKNVKKEQEISNEASLINFFAYELLIQEALLPKYVDLSKKEVFYVFENKIISEKK